MKLNLVCVFLVAFLFGEGSPESFMCYECDDCDVLNDIQLKSCPLPNLPKPPSINTPATESTKSTEESSSSPTQPETTSTQKPTQTVTDPSTSSTTTTPKSEIQTTKIPQETESPIITESETRPTITVTDSSEIQLSTDPITPITESPETLGPVTNQQNPSTISPTVDVEEIIQPEIVTKGPPLILSPVPSDPQSISTIQSFEPESESPNSFVPELMFESPQYNQYNRPYQIFNRIPREIRNARSFHCYSIDILDGEKKKVQKGCIEVPEDKAACDVLKNEFGHSVDKCKTCTADKCNSSSSLKYSVMTFVMVLAISFV